MEGRNRVVIAGPRIVGNMAACRIRRDHPELDVVICGRTDRTPPVVGESLTEFSTQFLYGIGLREPLEKEHFPKFGLTFYFRESAVTSGNPRYAVHEAVKEPPMPAHLINRTTFDRSLRGLSAKLGVRSIESDVRDIDLNGGPEGLHRVRLKSREGLPETIDCRWFIDATGRARLLGRKLGLHRPHALQRDTFWFRLADFDRSLLSAFDQVKTAQTHFDPYYSAHHFTGKGNWIWCIPMEDGGRELISIGIVSRPDAFPREKIRDIEAFLEAADAEHPHVAALVRSGRIVDTHAYLDYLYEAGRVYSEDRWFLAGDAADAFDPLYSTGLVMASIQCCQISAIIGRDISGSLRSAYLRDLEAAYQTIRGSLQAEVADLYAVIHDPYQAHWRVHIASAGYFFFLLPSILCGYFTDQAGARFIRWAVAANRSQVRSINTLLRLASARLGPLEAEKIPNLYFETVDWSLRGPDESVYGKNLASLSLQLARYRWIILKQAGWWRAPWHVLLCAFGLLNAAVISRLLSRPLSGNRVLRTILGVPGKALPPSPGWEAPTVDPEMPAPGTESSAVIRNR